MPNTTNDLLTVNDVAARLRLKPAHIYVMCYRGEIPYIKISRRVLRIALSDLNALIERSRVTPSTQATTSSTGTSQVPLQLKG